MGLLDKIKPAQRKLLPSSIDLTPSGDLTVLWEDGVVSTFGPHFLRARCPCAGCVEEWTGKRVTGEAQVSREVRCNGFQTVGNYAIQLRFSDKHDTGIYSWDTLRELREEQLRGPAQA